MKAIALTTITVTSTFLLGLPAMADQCSYISKEQALTAVSRLNLGDTIYQLCEPCGDETSTTVEIESLSAGTVGYQDFWGVNVNQQNIDLAYVFIESGLESPPINLAAVSGCPATSVSPTLPVEKDI